MDLSVVVDIAPVIGGVLNVTAAVINGIVAAISRRKAERPQPPTSSTDPD